MSASMARLIALLILKCDPKAYRRVEGARFADDDRPDLPPVAGACEVAEGALHLGEESHAGGAARIQ